MPRHLLVGITIAIAGLAALAAAPALAQSGPNLVVGEPPRPVLPRTRVEIHPAPLLYRRCVGWYEIQNRPSGPVLYPGRHCWWVRG